MSTQRSPKSPVWDLAGIYRVRVYGRPHIDRVRLLRNPWFAVLLSRIHNPDPDRDPHNHSRSFISACVTGSYTEAIYDQDGRSVRARAHRRFVPYWLSWRTPHRITETRGNLRTVVLAGRWHGPFSFFTPGGPVDYRRYG